MYRYIANLALTLLTLLAPHSLLAAEQVTRPRLVVNIVVGSMRAVDLTRYSSNFTDLGFNRMSYEGTTLSSANYSFHVGATSSSLATLSTGATPANHGVVGDTWFNFANAKRIDLTADPKCRDIEFDLTDGGNSPLNLIAPTLSESLREQVVGSQTVTLALDATSAIPFGGSGGVVLWLDPRSCTWTTSTAYTPKIYDWVKKRNQSDILPERWTPLLDAKSYINRTNFGLLPKPKPNAQLAIPAPTKEEIAEWRNIELYNNLAYTPRGNKHLLDMALHAIDKLSLGSDTSTDMINIMLNPSGNIVSRYGPDSVEAEDMYYRLDKELSSFIESVRSKVEFRDVVFVLTSDHGTSPSGDLDPAADQRLFNTSQFEVILNTFLGSRYGAAQWVIGYENSSIYLNHDLIYQKRLDLAKMQDDVASFSLQFRGVSHTLTATSLRSSYFGDGYGELIQRSYYPRRSGDVIISLMPKWRIADDARRSSAGSIYRYDTHVPLLIWGSGIPFRMVTRRVEMRSVAPTLAAIMKITEPAATEGEVIVEILNKNYSEITINN